MAIRHGKVRTALAAREQARGPDEVVHALGHWRAAKADDNIAWLTLDRAEESTNTLSEEVVRELDAVLSHIEGMNPRGLVIRSAKKSGFVAGADIRDFRGETDADEIAKRMTQAHEVIDRLDGLKIPTVAVIHGHCLGGGLELALACDHRIATPDAKLGFPEVMLGLHPGLGGTFRLPALIDPIEAMTMMLTGKSAHAQRARRLGLVDAVVEERHVDAAVQAAIEGKLKRTGRGWKHGVFAFAPARKLVAERMRKEAEAQAPSRHYPAPNRLIGLWESYGGNAELMQKAEIRSFSDLLAGEAAQNLIRVFFLREKLKGFAKGESGIAHVHVIGAGEMGREIAAWCASRGVRVTLADLEKKALAKAVGEARKFYDRKLHSAIDRRDALDRLVPDLAGDGASGADLVIEAIAEKAEVKKKVFAEIAPRMKPGALLATNTSSIPLETLREGLPHPDRLVGIHFFNPVTKMELVEVVAHDQASEEALSRARAFCGRIDRLPAPVKSAPGFLVNRALAPYLAEAFLLLDDGIARETIDKAATDFGMPMGPVELADRVGLDIALEVAESLKSAFPEEVPEIPGWMREKVDKKELGRKTGKGLYAYDDTGRPKRASEVPAPDPRMADRLILPMLNACVRLLREGIVEDADTLDGAMIFATGFAPFRGGPLHYARQRGVEDVVSVLSELEAAHGARFRPDEGWRELADA